jgi:hypothetical protein
MHVLIKRSMSLAAMAMIVRLHALRPTRCGLSDRPRGENPRGQRQLGDWRKRSGHCILECGIAQIRGQLWHTIKPRLSP